MKNEQPVGCREAFERWFLGENPTITDRKSLERSGADSIYDLMTTRINWLAWEAAKTPSVQDIKYDAVRPENGLNTSDLTLKTEAVSLEWQPIETAPKHQILLLYALADIETGNWQMGTGHYGNDGIWTWENRRLDRSYHLLPTHWMPLPNPPAAGVAYE